MNRICKNVRYLRTSQEKTKKWMAVQLGKSNTIVGNYESGRVTPPIDVILQYAEIFSVKASDILDKDFEEDGLPQTIDDGPAMGKSRLEREKDLLHQELDLRLEEIRILHESIRKKPAALAELKALDPELYEELEKMFPRE